MPEAEARAVVPRGNPAAEVAQQLGGGLQSAGQSIMRVEEINRLRVSRARVKEADAKLADGYRKILSPADGGYRSLLGRSAVDGRESVQQALQKHRESILGTLDPEQRDMISASESSLYQQALGSVDGHFAHQLQAFEIGESEARADQALRGSFEGFFAPVAPSTVVSDKHGEEHDAVDAPLPQAKRSPFEENRVTARTELSELARMRGYGPAQEAALLQKADDTLHASIVEKLTDEGRAVEAAKFVEKFGDRVSPDVRDKLLGRVREAGETEQAETIAAGLLGLPGSLTEKLDRLPRYRDAGVSAEVTIKAERRLLQMSEARRVDTDRAEADAFEAAKVWAQTNRTGVLPEDKRRALGSRAAAFDLWTLQGNQFITTGNGERRLAELKPEDLLYYKDQNDLVRAWQTDLSPKDLREVVLMWQKARGETLSPKDALTLERPALIRRYLSGAGFYDDNPQMPKDNETWGLRVGNFKLAVEERLNAKGISDPQNKDYEVAIHEVYGRGRVLNGKWMPEAMMLGDESKNARYTTLPFDLPDSDEDFRGYTRAGKSIESTLVADEQLAHRTGVRQVMGNVNQRLSDGALVRVTDDASIPTGYEIREQIIAERRAADPAAADALLEPTPQEIAARSKAHKVDLEQKRAAAERIASLENRVRAQAVWAQIPGEIDAAFGDAYAKELAAWEIVRHERLTERFKRWDGTTSGNAGPAPDPKQREALLEPIVRIQQEANRTSSSALPEKPSPGAVWRLVRDRVLARHASVLQDYPVASSLAPVQQPGGVQKFTTREGATNVAGMQTFALSSPLLPTELTEAERAELSELKKRYLITEKLK